MAARRETGRERERERDAFEVYLRYLAEQLCRYAAKQDLKIGNS